MDNVKFDAYQEVLYRDLPQCVKDDFFQQVILRAETEVTALTPVPCAKINWQTTTHPVLRHHHTVSLKLGQGEFTPTLVKFIGSDDPDDFYALLVDFGIGMLINPRPIRDHADLNTVLNELVDTLETASLIGRMTAASRHN